MSELRSETAGTEVPQHMYDVTLVDLENALKSGESGISPETLRAGAVLCSLETGDMPDLYDTLERLNQIEQLKSDEA